MTVTDLAMFFVVSNATYIWTNLFITKFNPPEVVGPASDSVLHEGEDLNKISEC